MGFLSGVQQGLGDRDFFGSGVPGTGNRRQRAKPRAVGREDRCIFSHIMFTDMLMLWSFGYAKTKFDVDFEKRSEARCVRVCPTHVAGGLACIACAPQKYVGPFASSMRR